MNVADTIATNVILTFIWSWNAFLWPLIVTRTPDMQTLPLGLARFLTMMEDTTGALYAFVVLVLIPGLAIFGVLFSWLLLGEQVTPRKFIGGAIVIFGVMLSVRKSKTEQVSVAALPEQAE